jgi:hypothetical protein
MHQIEPVRRRLPALLALAWALLGIGLRADAVAAPRVFTAVSAMAMICEIDPITGVELSSFMTPGPAIFPGMAFNGTEIFYTDENLSVIKVYLPDGTLVRDLPKVGYAGDGLGVSAMSLFAVHQGVVTVVNPLDGAFQLSYGVDFATQALTHAGSRGTLFVRVGDVGNIAEIQPDGTLVNIIAGPTALTGLCFSSSLNRLFGVRSGLLYALDPDTGALLPGYPVEITDPQGQGVPKTGACAADEVAEQTLITRTLGFWKTHPTVIDGSFDGPGGQPSLLPFEFCGKKIDSACDAVAFLSCKGGGLNNFKRQGMAAMLNCLAFNSCPAEIAELIAEGSAACASHSKKYPFGEVAEVLDAFNNSGSEVPLPFDPPSALPKFCKGVPAVKACGC